MSTNIEVDLGLAERVLRLRAASRSGTTALEYVRAELVVAEQAFVAGRNGPQVTVSAATTTTRPTAKAPAPARHGASTGLTASLEGVFNDGKVHTLREMSGTLGVTPKAIKKAIGRLVAKGSVKRAGKKGSGEYVRRSAK
jgi:hypothetical protein